jgi:hypothetical protein
MGKWPISLWPKSGWKKTLELHGVPWLVILSHPVVQPVVSWAPAHNPGQELHQMDMNTKWPTSKGLKSEWEKANIQKSELHCWLWSCAPSIATQMLSLGCMQLIAWQEGAAGWLGPWTINKRIPLKTNHFPPLAKTLQLPLVATMLSLPHRTLHKEAPLGISEQQCYYHPTTLPPTPSLIPWSHSQAPGLTPRSPLHMALPSSIKALLNFIRPSPPCPPLVWAPHPGPQNKHALHLSQWSTALSCFLILLLDSGIFGGSPRNQTLGSSLMVCPEQMMELQNAYQGLHSL